MLKKILCPPYKNIHFFENLSKKCIAFSWVNERQELMVVSPDSKGEYEQRLSIFDLKTLDPNKCSHESWDARKLAHRLPMKKTFISIVT